MVKVISLDTETTGLDVHHGTLPFMFLVCMPDGEPLVWEYDVDPFTRQPIYPKYWRNKILERIHGYEIVAHNWNYDFGMCLKAGLDLKRFKLHDTLIMSHLANSLLDHDLSALTSQYLRSNIDHYEMDINSAVNKARGLVKTHELGWWTAEPSPQMPSVDKKKWKADMWLLRAMVKEAKKTGNYDLVPGACPDTIDDHPWNTLVADYGVGDISSTLVLFHKLWEILEEEELLDLYNERMKLFHTQFKMQWNGITMSRSRTKETKKGVRKSIRNGKRKCVKIAKDLFDYDLDMPKTGVNDSMRDFFSDVMKLPVVAKSKKTGNASYNKDAIEKYSTMFEEGSDRHTFFDSLIAKRQSDTELSYIQGYERHWQPVNDDVMIIHSTLKQCGTNTLRGSSSNPNQQNIKQRLRYCYGPAPGREWYSIDYNNLELRIPAYESGEPSMVKIFESPDEGPYYGSYHLLIFDILHPKLYKKYGPEVKVKFKKTYYSKVKQGNFAVLYGAMKESGTADRAYGIPGAQQMIEDRLERLSALNQKYIRMAQKYGYVETIPDRDLGGRGYPLYVPLDKYGRVKPTCPLNYHTQGTACWVIQRAAVEIQEMLDRWNKGRPPEKQFKMIIQVHDEIVFDFPKGTKKWRLRKIRDIMERQGERIGANLTVGIDRHDENWAEGIEINLAT